MLVKPETIILRCPPLRCSSWAPRWNPFEKINWWQCQLWPPIVVDFPSRFLLEDSSSLDKPVLLLFSRFPPPHCSPPFCPTIFCSPQGSLCSPALLEIVMSKLPLSAAVVCMRQEHQVGPEVLHGGQRECSKADTSFYNCSGNGVQNALHQILLVKKAPLLASPYKPSCQRSSHPRSGRHS